MTQRARTGCQAGDLDVPNRFGVRTRWAVVVSKIANTLRLPALGAGRRNRTAILATGTSGCVHDQCLGAKVLLFEHFRAQTVILMSTNAGTTPTGKQSDIASYRH